MAFARRPPGLPGSNCDWTQKGRTAICPSARRLTPLLFVAALPGCQSLVIEPTDRSVYRVIHDRQDAALGQTSEAFIGSESGDVGPTDRMYSFNPRPLKAGLPPPFDQPAPPGSTEDQSDPPTEDPAAGETQDDESNIQVEQIELPETQSPREREELAEGDDAVLLSDSIFDPEELDRVTTFGLKDALKYAQQHARDLQSAKETLYRAALDLTLERHLWTPQFVSTVRSEYTDFGETGDFDRTLTALSDFAVSQRLPYGGDVTARVVNTLVRDLAERTTTGENAALILEANVPLLRGAGKTAYESRYVAERGMIYAVRTYERFRRSFIVRIAAGYFNLQRLKAAVANAHKAYVNRRADWARADFINRIGQSNDISEAARAKSTYRQAESDLVSAKEQYEAALDRFKIQVGMPVDSLLDVVDQEVDEDAGALDRLFPRITQDRAVAIAVKYRLDLLNSADQVDDARRGVEVAKNAILPDLEATGSVTFDSNPDHLSSVTFNEDRRAWRGGLEMSLDDRKRERNAYRSALINVRQSQRDYEEFVDTVSAEVRSALRRIEQQANVWEIQALQVEENEFRVAAARAQYELGRKDNQEVVDAENDLLTARNALANAISAYRNAIMEFRRDTGTLRVTDEGLVEQPPGTEDAASQPPPAEP